MTFVRGILIAGTGAWVSAHMAISRPIPLDASKGDNYRFPVSSGNRALNGGACHGNPAEANFAWVWTPANSGTCEIYQSCFDTIEGNTLTMSGGAAHGGGKCRLYSCTGTITYPPCVRGVLPDRFGTCTAIATDNDCTTKGSFTFNAATADTSGDSAANPPPDQIPTADGDLGGDDATVTKIRCGSSWTVANSRCGTVCRTDAACTVDGEKCFADLRDCPTGDTTPVTTDDRITATTTGCNSKKKYITNAFCDGTETESGCSMVWEDYCHVGTSATSDQLTITTCKVYAVRAGETWSDVALKFDVDWNDLKNFNTRNGVDAVLTVDTVIEVPGDCTEARLEVADPSSATQVVPVLAALSAVVALF